MACRRGDMGGDRMTCSIMVFSAMISNTVAFRRGDMSDGGVAYVLVVFKGGGTSDGRLLDCS